jgi:hypothetical protein
MKTVEFICPEEIKKFNLVKSKNLKINPDEVPTLISEEHFNEIYQGEDNPYFKIQEIDMTQEANGVLYTSEFWNSYLAKLKESPIPGSRDGHNMEWGKRPNTDLYLIGGKVAKDKKSVILKNYIPPVGESGDNSVFIRNSRANMIHFSIVAYTRDKIFRNEDGYITAIHALESIKGERNDAVELNLGAMKQKTNEVREGAGQAERLELDNGLESRKSHMEATMEPNEMLAALKTCVANGTLAKDRIVKDFELEIVTDVHRNAVAKLDELKKICGDEDIVKKYNDIVAENKELVKNNFDAIFDAKMSAAFGPKEIDGKENLKRNAAELLVTTKEAGELDAAIETAKKNSIILSFAGQEADVYSDTNITGKEIYKKNKQDAPSEFVTL